MLLRKTCPLAFAGLLLFFVGAALPCPPMCQLCSVYAAECEHISSLPEVLIGLPSHAEKILLRHGNVSKIPPLSFKKFYNLQFLSITGFLVSSLTDFTFSTLPISTLRSLDLSNNHLLSCTIEPMAFSGLVFLREFILTNNSLDVLRRSWFSEMPVLGKLYLGVNKIAYLPPRTFENLAKLNELVVSSNLIQYLPMDTFYGLPLLTKLDLSSNNILFINHEVFRPLQALKYLLLFQNRLTVLPVFPGSVTFLFLHQNPWDCSCQLADAMESLVVKIQTPADMLCSRPPGLAGRRVISVRPEGCASLSSPSPLLSTSSSADSLWHKIMNLSTLYGLLGGLFVGLVMCLICCCCVPRCCNCTGAASPAEHKQTFLSKLTGVFSSRKRTGAPDSPTLCSFPVVENTSGSNVARGICCGRLSCRTCRARCTSSATKRPLVAVLSVNKATGEPAVTLCERGSEMRCPSLDWSQCQTREGNTQRLDDGVGCSGTCGSREHCFATGEQELRDSAFRQATLHRMVRTECGMGNCIDTSLDRQISGSQLPQTLVRIDFPDGRAVKIERDRALLCETSAKRSGFHFRPSHSRSRCRSSSGSRPPRDEAGCTSPRCSDASEGWREDFTEKSQPKRALGSRKSAWKTIFAKGYLSSLRKGNKSRRRKHTCDYSSVPTHDTTSSSSLSSTSRQTEGHGVSSPRSPYVKMLSIAHRPLKRESFPRLLCDTPPNNPPRVEHGSQRQDADTSSTRNTPAVERVWKCQRCGCEESIPCSTAQAEFAPLKAAPRTSGRLSDATSQQPSSNAVHLKEREVALSFLGLHPNIKKPLSGQLWNSSCLSTLQPPFGVSHPGQEGDTEGTYEYPSPVVSVRGAALEAELEWQKSAAVFPLTERATTPSMEELLTAEVPLETLVCVVSQSFAEGQIDWASAPAGVMHQSVGRETPSLLERPVSSKSSCKSASSGAVGGGLKEATTVTSTCPLVQKMCQIDFPLAAEEEKASKLSD